ncbi:MAG TPA: peptidylprolyl isomerase [Acidimicrobiia bacterium]|nr:peptidylprolyl isomerase [Acidimicrobiia bacterium]
MSKASRRERQRENRAARRAYEERLAKRQKSFRTARRVGIIAVPAIVAIVLIQVLSGGSGTSSSVSCESVKKPPVKNVKLTTPTLGINSSVNYVATMKTSCGTITIALDAQQYPKAVNNFVSLANQGFYNNMAFVRAAKNFVVQAGSPDQSNTTNNSGPGYSLQAEVPTTAPGGSAYPVGTLAFATGGAESPGTADSQFFIVTGNQGLSLSPNYAIFGKVTGGLNVAEKIGSFAPANGDGPPTTEVVIKSVRITTPSAASPTSTGSTPPSS